MGNNNDSLGDRMKGYENISRIYLTRRTPVIIRIDGKAFHTFTRGFRRPFDSILMSTMRDTAKFLCEHISGCRLAYVQSDEISLLLTDYETKETQPWFDNNLQKLVSIAASMATLEFNRQFFRTVTELQDDIVFHPTSTEAAWGKFEESNWNAYSKAIDGGAMFDARAFILPKEEVCNYFIWRQQDATRNSILMVAQSYFSHNEMQGKTCDVLQDMLFSARNVNWNDYPTDQKRGTCIIKKQAEVNGVIRNKWTCDLDIPIFTQDRNYIDKFVLPGGEQ